MTVRELAQKLDLKIMSSSRLAEDRQIKGCYICDLLSWAMGRCRQDDVWITVQNNLNVVAVASLTDAACVIIPEEISIDQALIEKANAREVVVLSGLKTAYELASQIKDMI